MSNGLGRGLSSLIPQKVKKTSGVLSGEPPTSPAGDDNNGVLEISPDEISVNLKQPRKNFPEQTMQELADSIRQYGIIQPLIVSRKNGSYELIAGERRLRAAKAIGLEKVPVILRKAEDQEKLELALIENIQRQDLNPIETALGYCRLIDEFNLNQEELSLKMGKPRSSVANTLRLLNLPQDIQDGLKEGKISEGHAKLISGIEPEAKQIILYRKILQSGMTVEEAIGESRRMGGTKQARIKINYTDKDKEFAFREFFGTKAEIKRKGRGGLVIIYFYSDEELGEMAEKIKK